MFVILFDVMFGLGWGVGGYCYIYQYSSCSVLVICWTFAIVSMVCIVAVYVAMVSEI